MHMVLIENNYFFPLDISFEKALFIDFFQSKEGQVEKLKYAPNKESIYDLLMVEPGELNTKNLIPCPDSIWFHRYHGPTTTGIHRDTDYEPREILCRIGLELYGEGILEFYSEPQDKYPKYSFKYDTPVLINVEKWHRAKIMQKQERLVVFFNYSKPYKEVLSYFTSPQAG